MKTLIGLFISLCLLLFSCSPAPQPLNHNFSQQKKLEAAHHWEILANDFTKQIVAELQKGLPSSSGVGHFSYPGVGHSSSGVGHATESESENTEISLGFGFPYVYLQTNDRSSFGKAFRGYLINELTDLGYNISYGPEEALTVRWSVQKITHKANRKASMVPGTMTALTALGFGIYKAFDNGSGAAGAVMSGVAADLLLSSYEGGIFNNSVPHTEIILNLSISNNGILLARQSGTYYVNQEDTWHYNNIADFEGQKEIHLPTKRYEVVNHQ